MAEEDRARDSRLERQTLADTQAEIKELKSERTKLRRQVTNSQKKVDRLEAAQAETQAALTEAQAKIDELSRIAERLTGGMTIAELDSEPGAQISALLDENRRMADLLETSSKDLDLFRSAAEKMDNAVKTARIETETMVRDEVDAVIARKERENLLLRAQFTDLNRQLKEQGKVVSVPPERVAELVNGLVGNLRVGMPTMNLKEGQIRLKLGFGGTGATAGFIVPTPDSPPEVRESLNEITFQFDRAPDLSSPEK